MYFRDEGILIRKKYFQEDLCVITLFTRNHGLYSTVAKRSRQDIVIAEGNVLDFVWRARSLHSLGFAKCELIKSFHKDIIFNRTKLYAFNSLVYVIINAFHEREIHNCLFDKLLQFLRSLSKEFDFAQYIKLELDILAECGYKLNLSSCVVTGDTNDLYYVSPKSGCAVSKNAGADYADKLLKLPKFLTGQYNNEYKNHITEDVMEGRGMKENKISDQSIDAMHLQYAEAIELTTYFLNRYLLNVNSALNKRMIFVNHVLKNMN